MRSDFFYSKLKEFVKDLADLSGPYNPEDFLNEKLEEANKYGPEFAFAVMDDLIHIVRDHSKYFWNERHREQITVWFMSHAPYHESVTSDLFPEEYTPNSSEVKTQLKQPAIALIHYYNGEPITPTNAPEIAKQHGYENPHSGTSLYGKYNEISDTAKVSGAPFRETYCKQYEKQIIQSGLLKKGQPILNFHKELEAAKTKSVKR